MKYNIYIKGYKFYYSVEKFDLGNLPWTDEIVIELKNPEEVYEENLYSDTEITSIVGKVYIPVSQISHILKYD